METFYVCSNETQFLITTVQVLVFLQWLLGRYQCALQLAWKIWQQTKKNRPLHLLALMWLVEFTQVFIMELFSSLGIFSFAKKTQIFTLDRLELSVKELSFLQQIWPRLQTWWMRLTTCSFMVALRWSNRATHTSPTSHFINIVVI